MARSRATIVSSTAICGDSTTSSAGVDVDVVSVRLESYNGAVESDSRSFDNVIGRRQRPLRFYVFVRRFDPRLSPPR